MKWMSIIALLCVILPVGLAHGADVVDKEKVAALVKGVVARADVVFSGRLKYRVTVGMHGGKSDKPWEEEIVFMGQSWRKTNKHAMSDFEIHPKSREAMPKGVVLEGHYEKVEVSHGKSSVEYTKIPQPDKKIGQMIRVAAPKALRAQASSEPPVFAGSLWYPCQVRFIEQNASKAAWAGAAKVNGIDTQILEWEVTPEEKFHAFEAVNDLTMQGGRLRLYVAPQMGHVLPRIEHLGTEGRQAKVFESTDFVEHKDGVYIPRRCSYQISDSEGPGCFKEFELLDVKSINEAIPTSEFIIEIPDGALVSDARSGTHSTLIKIKGASSIPEDLTEVIALPSYWSWRRTPIWAVTLGIAGGLIALLAWRLLRRRALARAAK
jgi:hypothetical protein